MFCLTKLPPKQSTISPRDQKGSTIQYGYIKLGPHARVLSSTLTSTLQRNKIKREYGEICMGLQGAQLNKRRLEGPTIDRAVEHGNILESYTNDQ